MNVPEDLMYTKSHEWVRFLDNGNVRIGITQHAEQAMGDLVFVDLPQAEDVFAAGDSIAVVESVKAVSDVYAPVSGKIADVNTKLMDEPALINESCYDAWMIELEDVGDESLLTPEEYEELLNGEE